MSLRVFVLLGVCIMLFGILEAHATPEQYGIAYSRTCHQMLVNQINTDCPKPEELLALFPDTTDQRAVGKLVLIDGIIQRAKPSIIKVERFYDRSEGSVMWFDPPNDVRMRIKMIFIEPSLPAYKTGDESIKMDDYNVSFAKDRYITPNCGEAKISAKNWMFLLGDTMNLLKHDCDPAFTSFNGTVTLQFAKSYQDLATSNKYKLDEMVKLAKEKYKQYHIGKDTNQNPAVTEDENTP